MADTVQAALEMILGVILTQFLDDWSTVERTQPLQNRSVCMQGTAGNSG